jgi:energy-coupling factor transport system permease protein
MDKPLEFKSIKPDARVMIFQVIVVSLVSFILSSHMPIAILIIIMFILMIFHNMKDKAIQMIWRYMILLALYRMLDMLQIPYLTMMFNLIILLFIRVLPAYMSSIIMLNKMPMNEMITALENMYIPQMIILPFAVVYRYVPTIIHEISCIKVSLKMRGLNTSLAGIIMHPMKTIENFIIPLLIRSSKISDELSASSLCKGLDTGNKRTCLSEVRFQINDAIYCFICLVIAVSLIYIDKSGFFL